MNRREFLFPPKVQSSKKNNSYPPNSPQGLTRYEGTWGKQDAAHLLRRTMLGPSLDQIDAAAELGLDNTITQLMDVHALPNNGPINPGKYLSGEGDVEVDDPNVKVGEPWIKKVGGKWQVGTIPPEGDKFVKVQTSRNQTIRAWKTEQILKEEINIHEKMTLFWHNHFAIAGEAAQFEFMHIITLMENSLGNFKDLVKKITLDPAMLFFLNGNENTNLAPNENYARELLELYTIGKGPLADQGDYTNYTEEDVREASKVLTGWRVDPRKLVNQSSDFTDLTQENLTFFQYSSHDNSLKQFSHRFNHATISANGASEYADLIDMIFMQDECAFFICRKLYRWFVHYQITDEIEEFVIRPMADILIQNDYDIRPALIALLSSEHFFSSETYGQMIKNPYDFVMSILKPFGLQNFEAENPMENFRFHLGITQIFTLLQMTYFTPPNVAGWKAYYQEPLFYRTWINATSLNFRMNFTRNLALGEGGGGGLNVLQLIENIAEANDPNKLLEALSLLYFPQPISDEQIAYLKNILIPGLPDFEWTIEYDQYLLNPDDQDIKQGVESKLRQLFNAIFVMPEFYLS